MSGPAFDAVVLAGGRGSRLGGVDKAALRLQGQRLVDRAVAAASTAGAEQIVVVGPEHAGADGVTVVREDPPFAGPLAALAAALPFLRAEWVLFLSCDLVRPDKVCQTLVSQGVSHDGLALRDPEGHPQWLAGLYRVAPLRAGASKLGDQLENAPLRRLLGPLNLRWIEAPLETTADIDDHEDLKRAQALTGPPEGETP